MEEEKYEDIVLESMKKQRDMALKTANFFKYEIERLEKEQRDDPCDFDDLAFIRLYFANKCLYEIIQDYLDLDAKVKTHMLISPMGYGSNSHCI